MGAFSWVQRLFASKLCGPFNLEDEDSGVRVSSSSLRGERGSIHDIRRCLTSPREWCSGAWRKACWSWQNCCRQSLCGDWQAVLLPVRMQKFPFHARQLPWLLLLKLYIKGTAGAFLQSGQLYSMPDNEKHSAWQPLVADRWPDSHPAWLHVCLSANILLSTFRILICSWGN